MAATKTYPKSMEALFAKVEKAGRPKTGSAARAKPSPKPKRGPERYPVNPEAEAARQYMRDYGWSHGEVGSTNDRDIISEARRQRSKDEKQRGQQDPDAFRDAPRAPSRAPGSPKAGWRYIKGESIQPAGTKGRRYRYTVVKVGSVARVGTVEFRRDDGEWRETPNANVRGAIGDLLSNVSAKKRRAPAPAMKSAKPKAKRDPKKKARAKAKKPNAKQAAAKRKSAKKGKR